MPGLNRKGPCGQGAMSGKGTGYCNPENKGKSVQTNPQNQMSSPRPGRERGSEAGRGFGKGLRTGRGMRFRGNS